MTEEQTDPEDLQYGESYRENASLKDGTAILLRMVGPVDKQLLLRGFERLSPESRYFRFFAAKRNISDTELKRLTEVDGLDHVAIGAVIQKPDGSQEGLGIARFVRLPDEPQVAEPAIAVVDDYQNRGLGSILLQRLTAAAHERGIKRFRSAILADNVKMKRILGDMNPDILLMPADQGVIEVEFPLPERIRPESLEDDLRGSVAHGLLTHIAQEVLSACLKGDD